MPQSEPQIPQNKLALRQYLMDADKLIREKKFSEARVFIEKAKIIDPQNAYVKVFSERIKLFEQQKSSTKSQPIIKSEPKLPLSQYSVSVPPIGKSPQLPIQKSSLGNEQIQIPQVTIQPVSDKNSVNKSVGALDIKSEGVRDTTSDKSATETQLEEMKRQVEVLTKALEQEKKSREEMSRKKIQLAIEQYRNKLGSAWMEGAPPSEIQSTLRQEAISLMLPENVIATVEREAKIEAYRKATKHILSKKELVRNSASSLDWLRKVYQISPEEYLEFESNILTDTVQEQFKGTVFQISGDEKSNSEIIPQVKAMGYAVVNILTPEEALEKIEKLNPNLVICESNFGEKNISGIRFLHILRSNSKFNFVPFIFLADEEDYSLLSTSELRPNEGFVKKPFVFAELLPIIDAKLEWFKEYSTSLSK